MWQFATGLFLVELSPGSLRLTAIYGFASGGAILLLGALVGDWVDKNPRMTGKVEFPAMHYSFSIMLYIAKDRAIIKQIITHMFLFLFFVFPAWQHQLYIFYFIFLFEYVYTG